MPDRLQGLRATEMAATGIIDKATAYASFTSGS